MAPQTDGVKSCGDRLLSANPLWKCEEFRISSLLSDTSVAERVEYLAYLACHQPKVCLTYLFTSHSDIHDVAFTRIDQETRLLC
jgi:hypothetical protein